MHASTLPSARSDIGEVDLDLQDDRHEDFAEEWQVARGISSKMKHCRDWENCWPQPEQLKPLKPPPVIFAEM